MKNTMVIWEKTMILCQKNYGTLVCYGKNFGTIPKPMVM